MLKLHVASDVVSAGRSGRDCGRSSLYRVDLETTETTVYAQSFDGNTS